MQPGTQISTCADIALQSIHQYKNSPTGRRSAGSGSGWCERAMGTIKNSTPKGGLGTINRQTQGHFEEQPLAPVVDKYIMMLVQISHMS